MDKFQLEERLIAFSVLVIEVAREMPQTITGLHLAKQIMRSGTSASLNYGEAQSSESRRDFIHKMQVILKELRETHICLKIIKQAKLHNNPPKIDIALNENHELISIFVRSISTAKQKNLKS